MKKLLILLFVMGLTAGSLRTVTAQILDNPPVDGLFVDNGLIDKDPIPFPSIRKADVMWSKRIWREIDFRQKLNQPFYYPTESHNNWRNFMTVIMDGLKEGSFVAYDISNTDELLVPLTFNEVIARQTDTLRTVMTRPFPPYEQYDTTIFTEFDATRVMRLRVKEDWYFDKQRSQLMVRIIAFCPVMIKERNGQEVTEPLFWVSYPQSRDVLAKAEVFNRNNAAERRTFDEVFWKRMFDSYVYKEENVYDRRISQYATGIDALLESERIKMELFQFEHDLWEY
ncbi:MAG: gliding motility protein GldN [Bacteroidetes bacterium]|nr:gliding motility protein GldN [Bacteroidales bacterium]MBU1009057.1 gliding motility protein GldN [Bacteroidota bacterium]